MSTDVTEPRRREMLAEINEPTREKTKEEVVAELKAKHGEDNVWTTDELTQHFTVLGFMAPVCVVIRKSDGQKGSVTFTHNPRVYFDFEPSLQGMT